MPSPRELFQAAYHASNIRDFTRAKELYAQAVKLNPAYSMAWNNLGWILYDQFQQYEEARDCYQKALDADSENFVAWNNLGIYFYRQRLDYEEAERCWKASTQINPQFINAWKNLAVLAEYQHHNIKETIQYQEKVRQIQERSQKLQEKMSKAVNLLCTECGQHVERGQQVCESCGSPLHFSENLSP